MKNAKEIMKKMDAQRERERETENISNIELYIIRTEYQRIIKNKNIKNKKKRWHETTRDLLPP